MSLRVLALNAGSSSLKLSVLGERDATLAERTAPASEGRVRPAELHRLLAGTGPVSAVGHRIVHGGDEGTSAALVDAALVARLRAAGRLAPLHEDVALALLEAARRVLPGVPHVACFDDGFHATLPEPARAYAVPSEWGLRRRGFHGLSHAYAARRAGELLDRPAAELRLVTCHLGAGASAAAVAGGISVDTTMGATPNDGLAMATRSGSVDPGALLWVQEREKLAPAAMREALERRSGLLGLSGISSRMEEVIAAAGAGSARARLALDVYVHRLRAAIAAMAAAMDGIDAVVFTGGVGERSARVRAGACAGLGFLGVALDEARNADVTADADVSADGSSARVLVVRAREDVEIAALTRAAVAAAEAARV